jgi:hypothetical protein
LAKTGIVLAAILMSHLIDSDNVTVAVAGLLVLLLGIPHGATDPIIYIVIDSKKLTVKSFASVSGCLHRFDRFIPCFLDSFSKKITGSSF